MLFAESSHRNRWLLTPERLAQRRQAAYQNAAAKALAAVAVTDLVSMEEERKLLRYYLEQIPQVRVVGVYCGHIVAHIGY